MPTINAYLLRLYQQPSAIEEGRVSVLNGRNYRRGDPGTAIEWARSVICVGACMSGAAMVAGGIALSLCPEDDSSGEREIGRAFAVVGAGLTATLVYFFHRSGQDSYYTSD